MVKYGPDATPSGHNCLLHRAILASESRATNTHSRASGVRYVAYGQLIARRVVIQARTVTRTHVVCEGEGEGEERTERE